MRKVDMFKDMLFFLTQTYNSYAVVYYMHDNDICSKWVVLDKGGASKLSEVPDAYKDRFRLTRTDDGHFSFPGCNHVWKPCVRADRMVCMNTDATQSLLRIHLVVTLNNLVSVNVDTMCVVYVDKTATHPVVCTDSLPPTRELQDRFASVW